MKSPRLSWWSTPRSLSKLNELMMILVEMADQSGVDRRRRRANKQRERGQQGEGEAEHRRVARLKCGRGGKKGATRPPSEELGSASDDKIVEVSEKISRHVSV